MFKKLLIGAAALGLTAAALANGNAVSSAAVVAAPASEFNPGIYIGLQGGYAQAGWYRLKGDTITSVGTTKVTDDGVIGGRVYVGYDFTKNWALELGYLYFGTKTKFKANDTTYGDIRTQAFDLVGMGSIPVTDDFDVYGKLGVGYLMSKGLTQTAGLFEKDKQNNFAAVVGFGVEYTFVQNWAVDLSWTRYIVNKKAVYGGNATYGSYQPDADFYAIGIEYKFNM